MYKRSLKICAKILTLKLLALLFFTSVKWNHHKHTLTLKKQVQKCKAAWKAHHPKRSGKGTDQNSKRREGANIYWFYFVPFPSFPSRKIRISSSTRTIFFPVFCAAPIRFHIYQLVHVVISPFQFRLAPSTRNTRGRSILQITCRFLHHHCAMQIFKRMIRERRELWQPLASSTIIPQLYNWNF